MSLSIIRVLNESILDDNIVITEEFINECNRQLQQELFALPFNTYEVANLDGWKLYSSASLKRKYSESMYKIRKTKPIAKKIEELVNKNVIVPAWINKGIFRLTFFKIFAPPGTQGILGFYISKYHQIYLLIDNNITLGFASNIKLASLMIHESMHMAANNMKYAFVNLFKPELVAFYNAMLKSIFIIPEKVNLDKISETIILFLFKNFEFKKELSNSYVKSFIPMYRKLLDSSLKSKTISTEQEFNLNLDYFIDFVQLYFKDINSFISQLRRYQHIYRGLLNGYKNGLNVKNNNSLCVQELFYPSEIICMYSELGKNMSKVYKAFSNIRVR